MPGRPPAVDLAAQRGVEIGGAQRDRIPHSDLVLAQTVHPGIAGAGELAQEIHDGESGRGPLSLLQRAGQD